MKCFLKSILAGLMIAIGGTIFLSAQNKVVGASLFSIGLNNTKGMTQKEIADELKISRSYVSRIEKRALTKMLTEFIKNKNID